MSCPFSGEESLQFPSCERLVIWNVSDLSLFVIIARVKHSISSVVRGFGVYVTR